MAVYTSVHADQLVPWLTQFDLGALKEFRGISGGIENSNFFLTTERGEFVLTLFERLHAEELPFYLELMRHLALKAIPCPAPQPNQDGQLLTFLCGKPAAIVSKLAGKSILAPNAAHCAIAGHTMAQMHLAGQDYGREQANLRGLPWWIATVPNVVTFLNAGQRFLIEDELAHLSATLPQITPVLARGPIHADLFRDNALFDGDRLGGFIDFYFAGWDSFLFDVAVSVNDWCIDLSSGQIIAIHARAFLDAYHAVRPFSIAESDAWSTMLRAGAFRFWLSRLWDFYLPRPAQMLVPHDPTHFERILTLRRQECTIPLLP
jgi:homoserine kinase type II